VIAGVGFAHDMQPPTIQTTFNKVAMRCCFGEPGR
jgi:hypothetical protein